MYYKDHKNEVYQFSPIQHPSDGLVKMTDDEVREHLQKNIPVVYTVTRSQGKAALINRGLWPDVLAYAAGIEDETDRLLAEVALHDTTHWHIDSPFLCGSAEALGLSDDDKKQLFKEASEINL